MDESFEITNKFNFHNQFFGPNGPLSIASEQKDPF